MAPRREIDPQGLYHVISRGNFRQRTFLDDEHYARYLRLLQRVTTRRRWTVLDWCLIPNHVHLVVRLNEAGLSEGMRELSGCFSRWSNSRTGRTGTGHLWKNRFKSLAVVKSGHFWEILRYVPNNPVAAGLVARPEDWPWSGYRATIGLEHPYAFHQPAELLRFFGDKPDVAVVRYKKFVQDGLVRGGHATWSDDDVWHTDAGSPQGEHVVESAS
jgi:REP element-mobilizing transposase RayT